MKLGLLLILVVLPFWAAPSFGKALNEHDNYLDQHEDFGVPRPSQLPGHHEGVLVGDSLLVTLGGAFVFGFLLVSFFRSSRLFGIVFLIASVIGVAVLGHVGWISFQFSNLLPDERDIVGLVNGTGRNILDFFTSHIVFFFAWFVGSSVGLAAPTTR